MTVFICYSFDSIVFGILSQYLLGIELLLNLQNVAKENISLGFRQILLQQLANRANV